jgi:hypothetical protein
MRTTLKRRAILGNGASGQNRSPVVVRFVQGDPPVLGLPPVAAMAKIRE